MKRKRKTYLARSIEMADEKAQYDAYAKKIISDKIRRIFIPDMIL